MYIYIYIYMYIYYIHISLYVIFWLILFLFLEISQPNLNSIMFIVIIRAVLSCFVLKQFLEFKELNILQSRNLTESLDTQQNNNSSEDSTMN